MCRPVAIAQVDHASKMHGLCQRQHHGGVRIHRASGGWSHQPEEQVDPSRVSRRQRPHDLGHRRLSAQIGLAGGRSAAGEAEEDRHCLLVAEHERKDASTCRESVSAVPSADCLDGDSRLDEPTHVSAHRALVDFEAFSQFADGALLR
ncbi:hypothetical protein M1L58_02105 [Gordonia sp. C13]|nr:hypothetical protein [Gordonia sp. C13]MCK8612665.1 hypothetical protein [Gordonia sp. C13]